MQNTLQKEYDYILSEFSQINMLIEILAAVIEYNELESGRKLFISPFVSIIEDKVQALYNRMDMLDITN